MPNLRPSAGLGLALGLCALAAPALGQPRPGPAPQQAQVPDPSQDLVRRLNLRPDQQAAFHAYQAAFAAQDRTEAQDRQEAQHVAAMTTPQRLDFAAQQMERDRAAFDRAAQATRRLYAALDPRQQQTFDRLTAPQMDDEQDGPDPTGADPGARPPPPRSGR